ncbi:MAG TPA: RNA polymerase sigma factor [Baekduia sp.]
MTLAETSEDDLVSRSRHGDREAYGLLVARHQEVAFRTAYVICGDATEAQDAAQEGFIKTYISLARFRDGAPFRPWLLRIVANEARNRRRSAGRREHLVALAAAQPDAGTASASAEVAVLARERRATLAAALGRLAADHREVLVLRYLLDLSEQECAAVLGCRLGTVKSRHARALTRLRAELADDPEEIAPDGHA